MAKTNLLTDLDFTVLTALVLFLTVARRHDDTRFCWTATGLAIRIAQGLGLHRDGTHFGLPPFEVEMRRRVWWLLCALDVRGAEEAGSDLTIVNRTFDTEFPSNIDDRDISPGATEMPVGREGPTDMAVALVRHEIIALCRRLFALATASGSVCPKDAGSTLAERERMLVGGYERIESTFLRHLPTSSASSSSISVMIAMVARVVMAKASLIIYQPMLFPGAEIDLSSEIKERLFVSAVEIIEYMHCLNKDPRFKRWRWLFALYTHFHACAYILLEMSRRPWTPPLERAWAELNGSLADGHLLQLTKSAEHLAVWMPLRKLLLKAKRYREGEITRLRADPAEVSRLEREDRGKQTGSRFGHVAGMEVDHALVRRQWLALVAPERVSPQQSPGVRPRASQGLK
ncbi:MAG: fungal specific transcription factor domain-containing protein, partial [Acidobacteria bacterium]|nr:fungal specific transcription factor domain-containing protein [Acidobacteriota bacterium]